MENATASAKEFQTRFLLLAEIAGCSTRGSNMSEQGHWTKPLTRRLGGRGAWRAPDRGESPADISTVDIEAFRFISPTRVTLSLRNKFTPAAFDSGAYSDGMVEEIL